METEAEKTKRQRSERDDDADGKEKNNRKKKVTMKVAVESSESDRNEGLEGRMAMPMPMPSEEEVEEFFAIVRRMHVAVKYFGQRANDGAGGSRFPPGRWRAALEAEDVVVNGEVDDGGEEEEDGYDGKERIPKTAREAERVVVVKENGVLDLNSAPEEGCAT